MVETKTLTVDNPHLYVGTVHLNMTRNQINDTFLFQNRVKVKVVGDVSEK